ncbi:MAG: cell division protease FtsH, partial [Myxococcota bacterium]
FVTEWGMSNLGPVNFGSADQPLFLGRDIQKSGSLSEQMAIRVDREIQRLCMDQYDRALKILTDHRDILDTFAQGLLKFETLNAPEILEIAAGTSLDELEKRRTAADENRKVESDKKHPNPPSRDLAQKAKPAPSIVPMKPGGEEGA